MEAQDHKKANQSGHEGHSGVHVCHKCGWPFPNPHPSARHRRAHKRLCGTIEGYKLDNSQDKAHLDGSDGEHVSDDDHKITSDKVIERTISRKSSSGVGSRSHRSTRSEDEVFADAATEFIDGVGSEVAPDGVISRGNSLQDKTENDPEGFKLSVENVIGDDSSASSIGLEDKQLGNVQMFEGKNHEVKGGIPLQDQISSSVTDPPLSSASITRENENAVVQNLMRSFGASSGLDTCDEEHKDIAGNPSELRSPCSGTAEDVSEQVSPLKGVNEEPTNSVSAAGTEVQSTVFDDRVECPHTVDSLVNFHHSLNLAQEVDTTGRKASKSFGMVEEHHPKIEANSDVFPAQEHPEIAPEGLPYKGGNFNRSMAVEAPSAVESMEDTPRQEAGQTKPIAEEDTVGGLDQLSVHKASYGDITGQLGEEVHEEIRDEAWEDQEVSSIEERKSSVSSEKVFPEVSTTNVARDQESVYGGANSIDAVNDDDKHLVMHENDSNKVPVGNLPLISSKLTSVDDIIPQVKKPMNASDSNDVGNVEKIGVNEITVRIENENEPPSAEPRTVCGLIVAISNDDDEEPVISVRTHDSGKLDKIIDSGNLMVDHSQPENDLTPEGAREAQWDSNNTRGGECMNKVDTVPIVKIDDSPCLKTSEDAVSFCPSSTAAVGGCTEKLVEHASDAETDKITKQHTAVSAIDITDSSGQTDSQESICQSVSVPSALLDTFPANTAVSNSSRASVEQEAVSLEPMATKEVRYPENKTSIEPRGLENTADTSEIQTFENQKQTALKTLLGEAIAKSREESPTYNEIPAKHPISEASKEEIGREWDSPARYPVKIKTEKRKAKSKSSSWVPFLCCSTSSVNANGP